MENDLPMTCFLSVLVTAAYVMDAEGYKNYTQINTSVAHCTRKIVGCQLFLPTRCSSK